jgi:hypothetical protein
MMQPITSTKLTQQTSRMLCYYFNSTSKIQLVRIWNSKKYSGEYSWEKIIFPQQRILFEAKPEEILEVHTKSEGKPLLESIFSCCNLKINQPQPQYTAI